MRVSPRFPVLLLVGSVLGSAVAAAPVRAAPATTTFKVRSSLSAKTLVAGTASFTTPRGWQATNRAARHTVAAFRVAGSNGCVARITVSVRGKATGRSIAEQVRIAVGDAPFGRGERRDGAWGTDGPTLAGGEGEPLLTGAYGFAPVRVQTNRYAQIRAFAVVHGCDRDSAEAHALVARNSRLVRQINHLVAKARTTLRVTRL
ncbi:hypothetical protein [Patulibacter sp. SYSU D01012]|uniref:hypothetical protein n=1 Tax=Patulibacter sp. SYSU D01012 TaxID=2817381 RepID=UPI001B3051DF|nr:hypothetical protein [Patulibacter sp. SYSU D01012]